ncbi:hypothetical protein PLICRDRAFT_698957 [Plicaturopsis crispa FD-325 SS-3]|nr:hypothetical protein PLICRDRAFT_698957 [Plicaturopsis crispa FD-325 SS-3]
MKVGTPPALTLLRKYAQLPNPTTLPPDLYFSHTQTSLTIFDCYPKSIFHFLILPRVQPDLPAKTLSTLKSLLKGDRARAKSVLEDLRNEAEALKVTIEEEMVSKYGFKWGIWTGFHAVQSMEHMHLHVISDDLVSERLKNKKHYNSFHPKLGFFLHLEDVLSWFDAEPSYYDTMSELKESQYEPLLKDDMECWRCGFTSKKLNLPTLKKHLQEEHDKVREAAEKQRKRAAQGEEQDEEPRKRRREAADEGESSK